MEQLLVVGRNNGKAVLCQLLLQLGIELHELMRIDEVRHVHAQSLRHVEVVLQQFSLALLQFLNKCLFIGGQGDVVWLY